ncbi:hypothetical protein G3494_23220 [Shewanella baltica]|nr:hypothetical protein [Shewanella baltica]
MTQIMEAAPSRLEILGKVAKQDKHLQFNSLLHKITPALLYKALQKQPEKVNTARRKHCSGY